MWFIETIRYSVKELGGYFSLVQGRSVKDAGFKNHAINRILVWLEFIPVRAPVHHGVAISRLSLKLIALWVFNIFTQSIIWYNLGEIT